jgi:hypothetical protein
MNTHTIAGRVLIDARTAPVTITTLPPDRLPAPVREAPPAAGSRARLAQARPVRLLPGPSVRRGPRVTVRVAATLAVLAAVAVAGALAGHARLGLSALATLGRTAVAVAVLVGLGCLAAGAVRVHCPGCRGVRR